MLSLSDTLGPAISAWEHRLSRRDGTRRVTAFAWGWEWLRAIPLDVLGGGATEEVPPRGTGAGSGRAGGEDGVLAGLDESAGAAEGLRALAAWNRAAIAAGDRCFAYAPPADYRLEASGESLRFRSPVETPYPENNVVTARWFPARGERAVVVLPQWNAAASSHVGLCRILQRAGIASLRLSLPYHDARKPAELDGLRAEYTVDCNLGRTIHAARQAVCDTRACLDWLEARGHRRLGIAGTSLGSCYALLASAHEPRLRANVFNHVSLWFGDVVWTGLATRHVRAGIAPRLDQAELREAWAAISPASWLDSFQRLAAATGKRNLLIHARYDPCFLPEFSRRVLAEFDRRAIAYRALELPCGHYTLGRAPFKYMDAWAITRFLRREL